MVETAETVTGCSIIPASRALAAAAEKKVLDYNRKYKEASAETEKE